MNFDNFFSPTASITHLLLGRLILGFVFGMVAAVANIYISEISSKNYRGRFNNMAFLFNGVGVLLQFFAGSYLSIWFASLMAVSISGLFFFQCFFIVESPYVLLARGKENRAMLSLKWLRASRKRHLNDEYTAIVNRVHTSGSIGQSLKILLSKRNRKGFLLIIMLSFLGDMTGRAAVLTYAKENFISDVFMTTHSFTVLLGICIVVMSIIPALLADRIGARSLIFKTSLTGGVLQLVAGTLFYLHLRTPCFIPFYGWLIFMTTGGYLCCAYIFSSNVMSLRGELIPENSRGLASGITSMTYAVSIITSIKLYQIIRDLGGVYWSFWLLTMFSFTFAVFTWMFIPDTKNKTLEQIQNELEMKDEIPVESADSAE